MKLRTIQLVAALVWLAMLTSCRNIDQLRGMTYERSIENMGFARKLLNKPRHPYKEPIREVVGPNKGKVITHTPFTGGLMVSVWKYKDEEFFNVTREVVHQGCGVEYGILALTGPQPGLGYYSPMNQMKRYYFGPGEPVPAGLIPGWSPKRFEEERKRELRPSDKIEVLPLAAVKMHTKATS